MVGKIFTYLGPCPKLGACRPDIRRKLEPGDHIFVISGNIPQINQFIMGGFEIEAKIDTNDAYQMFPEQRLRLLSDGQLTGNVIVDAAKSFDMRVKNYVSSGIVGCLGVRGGEKRYRFGRRGAEPAEPVREPMGGDR